MLEGRSDCSHGSSWVAVRRSALIALGALLDARELTAPVALEPARPLVERPDGLGVGAIEHLAPVAAHIDQPDVTQHARCFETDGCGSCSATTMSPTGRSRGGEIVEDVAPTGFRDRIEGVGGRGRAGHGRNHIPMREYVKPPTEGGH